MGSDYKKNILSILKDNCYRHDNYRIFRDWVELMAIALSNRYNTPDRDQREAQYMETIGRYETKEIDNFCKAFAQLVLLFEKEGFNDWLGQIFMELELGNERAGQFFTPYCLSQMMASMTLQDPQSVIDANGEITISEPAIGSGGMVIAAAEHLKNKGINYSQYATFTGVDVDDRCVHMSYIQLSLLNIPAVIIHGNTLTLEERSHWYTGAYLDRINQDKIIVEQEMVNAA
jgi:type I restriction-modification system DNA methylase subunit